MELISLAYDVTGCDVIVRDFNTRQFPDHEILRFYETYPRISIFATTYFFSPTQLFHAFVKFVPVPFHTAVAFAMIRRTEPSVATATNAATATSAATAAATTDAAVPTGVELNSLPTH